MKWFSNSRSISIAYLIKQTNKTQHRMKDVYKYYQKLNEENKLLTCIPFSLESSGDSNLRGRSEGGYKKEKQMQENRRAFYLLF